MLDERLELLGDWVEASSRRRPPPAVPGPPPTRARVALRADARLLSLVAVRDGDGARPWGLAVSTLTGPPALLALVDGRRPEQRRSLLRFLGGQLAAWARDRADRREVPQLVVASPAAWSALDVALDGLAAADPDARAAAALLAFLDERRQMAGAQSPLVASAALREHGLPAAREDALVGDEAARGLLAAADRAARDRRHGRDPARALRRVDGEVRAALLERHERLRGAAAALHGLGLAPLPGLDWVHGVEGGEWARRSEALAAGRSTPPPTSVRLAHWQFGEQQARRALWEAATLWGDPAARERAAAQGLVLRGTVAATRPDVVVVTAPPAGELTLLDGVPVADLPLAWGADVAGPPWSEPGGRWGAPLYVTSTELDAGGGYRVVLDARGSAERPRVGERVWLGPPPPDLEAVAASSERDRRRMEGELPWMLDPRKPPPPRDPARVAAAQAWLDSVPAVDGPADL